MSDLVSTLRAIVRDELARMRAPELATVTQIFAKSGDDSPANHQVNLKLRASGVELQRVPVTVGRLGLSALPQVGDLMVVAFLGGDLNAPVALGCIYDDQAHPPKADEHELVYVPPDDAQSGVKRFYMELKSGSKLTIDDDTVKVEAGDTSLVINKDGDVVVKAKGKVQIQAQSDIELDGQGDIKITAQGSLSLKGTSAATLEGTGGATVKGPQVTLAGMTQFSAS